MSYPLEVPVGSEASSNYLISTNQTSGNQTPADSLTYKQQLKHDANELAELILKIYEESQAGDRMDSKSSKEQL